MDEKRTGFWKVRKQYFKANPKVCSRCYSSEDIQLHHKIELQEGGTHDFTNLVPLCQKCHIEWHVYTCEKKDFNTFLEAFHDWEYKEIDFYKNSHYELLFASPEEIKAFQTRLHNALKENREERKKRVQRNVL